ncbi:MAG: HAD family hydrolase, partial [Planctomycetes bacterium]|nr:HAD family hydrolase [Planctomycetota bacterium]
MHVCLFDIDGTLLATGGAGKAAMEMALRTAFGGTGSAEGVPFSGRTDRAIARDLFRMHAIENSPANWQRFLNAYLEHLPASLSHHEGKVLPGIVDFLEH